MEIAFCPQWSQLPSRDVLWLEDSSRSISRTFSYLISDLFLFYRGTYWRKTLMRRRTSFCEFEQYFLFSHWTYWNNNRSNMFRMRAAANDYFHCWLICWFSTRSIDCLVYKMSNIVKNGNYNFLDPKLVSLHFLGFLFNQQLKTQRIFIYFHTRQRKVANPNN